MAESSVQMSFRLSRRTAELLEQSATNESRNARADRLLGEGLRLERHPLIRFHQTAGGRRRPLLTGTRLYVRQVISTLRAGGGDLDDAAECLDIPVRLVAAAADYYGDFKDEIDEDAAEADAFERDERQRWERRKQALA